MKEDAFNIRNVLHPLFDNVVVEEIEEVSSFYVAKSKEAIKKGKVVACNPSHKGIKPGDTIHYEKSSEAMIELEGKEVSVITYDKILVKEATK